MDKQLRQRISMANPVHFLALGFGSGLAPKAPGTFGSLAALPLVLLQSYLSLPLMLAIIVLATLVGFYLCGKTAEDMQVHDHSSIVWDEVVGMLITFIAIPLSVTSLLAGFALFRLFDIVKPWPIRYLDKHVHGGVGIMVDDILAGIFALVCMHILILAGWLG